NRDGQRYPHSPEARGGEVVEGLITFPEAIGIHFVLSSIGRQDGVTRQYLTHDAQGSRWGQSYPTGTYRRLLTLPEGDQVSRAPAPTRCQQGRQGLQSSANIPDKFLGWVKQPVLVRHTVDVQYTLVIRPTPGLEQLDNIEAKRENQVTLGDQLMAGL